MKMRPLLAAFVLSTSCTADNNTATEPYFTVRSTVGEVIHDAAFGDFGRLLFPVDRPVPETMTLAQASTSSVYIFYTNLHVENFARLRHRHEDGGGRLGGRRLGFLGEEPGIESDRASNRLRISKVFSPFSRILPTFAVLSA